MRTAAITVGVCLSIIGSFFAKTSIAAAVRIETKIPPQLLVNALRQFATLEHMHLLYLTADVQNLRTSGASGYLTADEALSLLLKGTGLKYRYLDGETVTIIGATGDAAAVHSAQDKGAASVQRATDPQTESVPPKQALGETRLTATLLHEVIVTAQKYRQSAFDVPISLNVVSGAELLAHGITNLSNLQYDVPGLYMNSSGYSQSVYIRGVANDSGNGAVVGQYIDEADVTAEDTAGQAGLATGDAGLYDLNRVEVLKGPQGTLYGDGSLGGVIRYITNKPALDRFEMSADIEDMITEDGAPSERVETMLNTPVVDGEFGLRFAGIFEHDGGWVDEPAANIKHINSSSLTDVRAEALWQPTDRLGINATQIVHRHASGLGMGEDSDGNITPLFGTALTPNQSDSSDLSNITVSYDFDTVRLLSSASYLSETQDIYNLMISTPLGAQTYWTLYPLYSAQNKDYSEEFRLVRSDSGPWQWTVGGFYKHFRDELSYSDYAGYAGSTLSSAFFSPPAPFGDTSTSKAAFASTSYGFFDVLTVGAGMRYYSDRETDFPQPQATTFTSTDPRFYVQFYATPNVDVYTGASKGFRSGGFNYPGEPPYQPESLWSYDLGTKMRLPEHGVRFEMDLFYMNYSNYVSLTYVPPQYVNANIGKARIKGVDADLTWRPGGLWQFSLNTEILNTDFLTASALSGYAPGNRLPFAPPYSFTGSVAREFDVKGKRGDVELYYYEIGRVQDRSFDSPVDQSDVQRFLNLRGSIHWSDNLQFGMFARNILNDRENESPWASFSESVRPRPRTLGVSFNMRFR